MELSFVEHDAANAGSRRFNVFVQGVAAHKGLDIYAIVGGNSAFQSVFEAKADAGGWCASSFAPMSQAALATRR